MFATSFPSYPLTFTHVGLAEAPQGGEHRDGARQTVRVSFTAQIQNLTNHKNYTGYSGVMTSPFFRTPTSVAGTRKIDLGMTFFF